MARSGPALLEYLDELAIEDRDINAPFMLPISEKYNEMGACVMGKLESGRVKKGDSLLLMPNKVSRRPFALSKAQCVTEHSRSRRHLHRGRG